MGWPWQRGLDWPGGGGGGGGCFRRAALGMGMGGCTRPSAAPHVGQERLVVCQQLGPEPALGCSIGLHVRIHGHSTHPTFARGPQLAVQVVAGQRSQGLERQARQLPWQRPQPVVGYIERFQAAAQEAWMALMTTSSCLGMAMCRCHCHWVGAGITLDCQCRPAAAGACCRPTAARGGL
jgi:hypothetical protein